MATTTLALIILVGLLFVFFASGMPIISAFLFVDLVGLMFWMGGIESATVMIRSFFATTSTFLLIPIPLFVLMASIFFESGLSRNVIDAFDLWLGRLPGRLSILAVIVGGVFGALCGSSVASTAVLGAVMGPEMERRGYKSVFLVGPIISGGGLAILIPPSLIAVVLGSMSGISISRLLIGGFLPGIFLILMYSAYIVIHASLRPDLAPPYPTEEMSVLSRLKPGLIYILPLVTIVFLVTGVIIAGIATASEASALGCAGMFGLVACYRKLNWQVIKRAFFGAVTVNGMILGIIMVATCFSQILSYTGVKELLSGAFLSWGGGNKFMVIAIMGVVLLIMGCLMDAIAIIMISVPIFMPIVNAVGIDPIWFGESFIIYIIVGGITPPVGLLLFVCQAVMKKPMTEIVRSSIPYMIIDLIVIIVMAFFPVICTWLPDFFKVM